MVLSALSANLHFSRDKVFARTDLVKACRIIFKEYSTIDIIALEKELLMDGLIERVGAQLQFSHLSFQEYLAAKYFIGSPRRAYIRKALKMFLEGDDWWAEVIKFCIQLSANPAEFEQWIKEEADIIGIYRDDKKINDLTLVVNECLPDPVVS
jgi:predicted NACHT family NTPase